MHAAKFAIQLHQPLCRACAPVAACAPRHRTHESLIRPQLLAASASRLQLENVHMQRLCCSRDRTMSQCPKHRMTKSCSSSLGPVHAQKLHLKRACTIWRETYKRDTQMAQLASQCDIYIHHPSTHWLNTQIMSCKLTPVASRGPSFPSAPQFSGASPNCAESDAPAQRWSTFSFLISHEPGLLVIGVVTARIVSSNTILDPHSCHIRQCDPGCKAAQ
jgi:hypothetical protein